MSGRRVTMTDDELEALVSKAVLDSFAKVGLRVEAPEDQDEAREDFRFIRLMRRASYGAASKIGLLIIIAIVSGIGYLISQGFKLFVRG